MNENIREILDDLKEFADEVPPMVIVYCMVNDSLHDGWQNYADNKPEIIYKYEALSAEEQFEVLFEFGKWGLIHRMKS